MLHAASRTQPPYLCFMLPLVLTPPCASRWIHPRRPQPTRPCCTFLSRASNTLATLSRCASGVNDRSADGQSVNGALRAVNWRRRRARPPKPLLSRVHPCMGPRPPHSSHACGEGEGAHARGRVASLPATRWACPITRATEPSLARRCQTFRSPPARTCSASPLESFGTSTEIGRCVACSTRLRHPSPLCPPRLPKPPSFSPSCLARPQIIPRPCSRVHDPLPPHPSL